jgi:hypothetical protein
VRRQPTHVRAYDGTEQTEAYYDQSMDITNFAYMSIIIIPYSPISNSKPGVCPPVRKSSDDSVQLTSKATIKEPISFVEDKELDVLHPVLDSSQSLDVVSQTTRGLQQMESVSLFSLSHDGDGLIRTATSKLAWSADLFLLMLASSMTILTDNQLLSKSLSASTLI